MKRKYKKQVRVAIAVALAAASIAYSTNNLFAQSEDTLTDVEEIKEENIEIEGLETEVKEVKEENTETGAEDTLGESLESEESIQHVERAVGDVTIDALNFPNAEFRKYISTNFDINNDGILSSDEITNISSINVNGNQNITSVQGIEYFPNLRNLNCANTGITSIDVSKNIALEELGCYRTSISSLDLSKNVALRYLYCNNTNIASLDLSKNTELRRLDCFITKVTSLDLSKNTELVGVFCPGLGITNLDISKNTKLAWIYIGNLPNTNVTKSNSVIDLGGVDSTFNMYEMFCNIYDLSRIQSMSGASLNKNTGVVSGYTFGTPITYVYDCGTSANGAMTLQVTLNVKGKSSIDVHDSLDKVYDGQTVAEPTSITKTGSNGDITFEWYQADGTPLQTAPSDAGSYKVKATLAEDNQYIGAEVEKEFTITKASSSIAIHDDLNKTYDGTAVIEPTNITKTGSTGAVSFEWYTINNTQLQTGPTEAGDYKVKAVLVDDVNHIGTEVEEVFTITKASSTITIHDDLNKTYDGTAVVEPINITPTGSTGNVSFEWYTINNTQLQTGPTEAGDYKVKAILAGDTNYDSIEVEKSFTISKAMSTITINDDLNKVYDGMVVVDPTNITTTGSSGTVSIKWYTADGVELGSAPVNAGSYKVKLILASDTNYDSVEVEKSFTISKATSTIMIHDELNKEYDGMVVVDPTNITTTGSAGIISYQWYTADGVELGSAPSEVGNYRIVITLGEDRNHNGVITEAAFLIKEAQPNNPSAIEDTKNESTGNQVSGIQTGDSTKAGLWIFLVGVSIGLMLFFIKKSRKED